MRVANDTPTAESTWRTLRQIAALLDQDICWRFQRAYRFRLGDGWALVVTPESARRFRLELAQWGESRAMLLTRERDFDRLAGAVEELVSQVPVGVGGGT